MRRLGLAAAFVAASLLTAPAVGAERITSEQATVSRLSKEWTAAIEHKDREALDRIVAKDFALHMPGDDRVVRRQEWIANVIAKDWSNFRHENLVVSVDGDRATVTSRLHFKVAPIPITLDSGIVDEWEKRDGHWQVTDRHLGDSRAQHRIAFFGGMLAAIVVAVILYALWRLVRRRKPSRAG